MDAVPGVRFLIDTGHVTAWGGDVLELLPFAGHVQLRDARPGEAQVAPGEGDVDFGAVFGRLEEIGYAGAISIEYFDLPENGWPCADPRGAALALRDLLRAISSRGAAGGRRSVAAWRSPSGDLRGAAGGRRSVAAWRSPECRQ